MNSLIVCSPRKDGLIFRMEAKLIDHNTNGLSRVMLLERACNNYLDICEKNKNLSDHTLKAYRIDFEQFSAFTDRNTEIQLITKEQIRAFQQLLGSRECKPATIKRKLACIRAMFRWYELEEVLDNNIFHKLNLNLRTAIALPKNIPTQEIKKLIRSSREQINLDKKVKYSLREVANQVKTSKCINNLTTLVALELMLCTGVRVGELVDITLESIDFGDRKIKIFGKGMRERFVFLPDQEICNLIKAYLVVRLITRPDHGSFLVNSRGKPASTQFIRKLIRNITSISSISRQITPHMCRHSAACQLLEAGIDIRYVQRLLGHQSISTTEIYTHVNDKVLQAKVTLANVRGRY